MLALPCVQHRPVRSHRFRAILRRNTEHGAGRALAAILLLLLSPVLAVVLALGARFRRTSRMGRHGRQLAELSLVLRNDRPVPWVGWIPRLFQVVRGELAWVGPEPRRVETIDLRDEAMRRVVSVVPGLVSTWWLRQQTNIAFGEQLDTDLEYVERHSLKSDAGTLLRSMLALAYGRAGAEFRKTVELLGIPIDNVSIEEALDRLLSPAPAGRGRQVSFVNADCVNLAFRDSEYRDLLVTSDLRLGDGIGLRVAGRLLGCDIRQNVNGTDLFPRLCSRMQDQNQSLFLFGGRPGVAEGVAAWVERHYPRLSISGVHHGYLRPDEDEALVEKINRSGASVLLVALGAPRQERWIRRHLDRLQVRSALGVGGLFDF